MLLSRSAHINESRNLLWELVTVEPTVLQCFNIIEATCMSQGIICKIDGEPCSTKFQAFIDEHYIPFAKSALRSMLTYGFVPFHVRKLKDSRDETPEIIPHGTFHWFTETRKKKQTDDGGENETMQQHDDDSLLQYRIQLITSLTIKDSDVIIYPYTQPCLDVAQNSSTYATVNSPFSHILVDYKNLRQAQLRRSYADAWNTTARLMCTFKPTYRVQEDPNSSYMDFADDNYLQAAASIGIPLGPSLTAHNFWTRDKQIKNQFERYGSHVPEVYTLPRDHDIDTQPMLTPCEDMEFLLSKFQRDVTSIMGIPYDMIQARGSNAHETVKKTISSGKIFSSNMYNYCRYICGILKKIYKLVYKKDNVEFIMIPLPKLELESIADLKILHEIGAITPDTSLQLSSILLGEEMEKKRKRTEATMQREKMQSQEELESMKNELGTGKQWTQIKRYDNKQMKENKKIPSKNDPQEKKENGNNKA
jgi:hypothetical protein